MGKTAIITGGYEGIGKAIVLKFLKKGYTVYASSRDKANIDSILGVIYFNLDLRSKKSINNFEHLIDEIGTIDVFINNAGCYFPQTIETITDDKLEQMMQTNIIGPIKLSRSIAKSMKKNKYGHILYISSIASVVSKPKSSVYGSTKAALLSLTRTLAVELAEDNIIVNCLSPGPTQTAMVEQLLDNKNKQKVINAIPLKRLASVNEIASIAYFLCSQTNSYITGQNIIADGGFTCR